MNCEPGARRRQWDEVQQHLSPQEPAPLLSLMHHNSIMGPGVDTPGRFGKQ